MDMDPIFVRNGLITFILLIASLSLHEWGHAIVADLLGDDTPRMDGRVTLNPLVHLDLLGTVILPLFNIFALGSSFPFIAWAKPVRVNLSNFRHRARDDVLVTFAGPATNLAIALVAGESLELPAPGAGRRARDVRWARDQPGHSPCRDRRRLVPRCGLPAPGGACPQDRHDERGPRRVQPGADPPARRGRPAPPRRRNVGGDLHQRFPLQRPRHADRDQHLRCPAGDWRPGRRGQHSVLASLRLDQPVRVVPDLPVTLGGWLRRAERLYAKHGVALGQTAALAHDEALYLILRTLGLPLDSGPSVLGRKLSAPESAEIGAVFDRRLAGRVPAAYITREAWLGGMRFYVDERVLIPRSYFVEIIPEQAGPWLPDPARVTRIADVCTGSGCLAILLARHFKKARLDAIDLSADA